MQRKCKQKQIRQPSFFIISWLACKYSISIPSCANSTSDTAAAYFCRAPKPARNRLLISRATYNFAYCTDFPLLQLHSSGRKRRFLGRNYFFLKYYKKLCNLSKKIMKIIFDFFSTHLKTIIILFSYVFEKETFIFSFSSI